MDAATIDDSQPSAERAGKPAIDPRPWPRYFARTIDVLVFGAVGMLVLVIAVELIAEGGSDGLLAAMEGAAGMVVSSVLAFLLAMLPIALLLAFAQTPGKWLFGIRVRNADGSRMGLWKAVKREAWVLVRGVGLGFPVVTLFTHVMSYSSLKDDGITVWDQALGCDVRHAPATPLWWVRATLGGALVLAATAWGYVDYFASMLRS